MDDVLADLAAEHSSLDDLVASLDEEGWSTITPAEPWTVRDQIGHLAFFDERATLAATDPEGFGRHLETDLADGVEALMSGHLDGARAMTSSQVLGWWRRARTGMLEAFRGLDPNLRVPWYGTSMRARTSAAARLMETWAHGEDVADALGVTRLPTDRLFHVADLGVRTFRHSFEIRGLPVPEARVRVALRGPGGRMRVWNDEAEDSITGPVEEFCRVVTQRRHHLDTHLVAEGDIARQWLEIAQAFAGPPGPGRRPLGVM